MLFDLPGEDRILVPSPDVATYDLQPEMCAYEVTEKVIEAIEKDIYDMIILNFANADMVGHTGVFEAAVKAIETLDQCVPRIADAILRAGGQILLTADHGNADEVGRQAFGARHAQVEVGTAQHVFHQAAAPCAGQQFFFGFRRVGGFFDEANHLVKLRDRKSVV